MKLRHEAQVTDWQDSLRSGYLVRFVDGPHQGHSEIGPVSSIAPLYANRLWLLGGKIIHQENVK